MGKTKKEDAITAVFDIMYRMDPSMLLINNSRTETIAKVEEFDPGPWLSMASGAKHQYYRNIVDTVSFYLWPDPHTARTPQQEYRRKNPLLVGPLKGNYLPFFKSR